MLKKREKKVLKSIAVIVLIAFFMQTGPVYAFSAPAIVAEGGAITTELENNGLESNEIYDGEQENPQEAPLPEEEEAATPTVGENEAEEAATVEEGQTADSIDDVVEEFEGRLAAPQDALTEEVEGQFEAIEELVEMREPDVKYFLNADKSYTATVYDHEVHYLDEEGNYQDIDNRLMDEKDRLDANAEATADLSQSGLEQLAGVDDVLENRANALKVQFAKRARSNKLVKLEVDGYKVSWSLLNTAKQPKVKKMRELNDAESAAVKRDNMKAVVNTGAGVSYEDIQANVDLKYDIVGTTLKESIVLKAKDAPESFQFQFKTGDLIAKEEGGYIHFQTADGETVYSIEPLFMYDAAFEGSSDIQLSIETVKDNRNNHEYIITVTPDRAWLQAAERVYPVVIDPTISTPQSASSIVDTYVSAGSPDLKPWNYSYLKVGVNGADKNYTMLRFVLPSQIQKSDRIVPATVSMAPYLADNSNLFGELASSKGKPIIEAHAAPVQWYDTSICYSNYLSASGWTNFWSTSQVLDYEIIDAKDGVSANDRWYNWDVTPLVDQWYTAGDNRGLIFRYNEANWDAGQYGSLAVARFTSSNRSGYSAVYPVVNITYLNTIGLEDYWTYHAQGVGIAGTGYVQDFNGGLTFSFEDFSLESERIPLSVTHNFSSFSGLDMYPCGNVGRGFRLNLHQTITSVGSGASQKYKYVDGDGTVHWFEKNASDNKWKDDSGLDLTLAFPNQSWVDIVDKEDCIMRFASNSGRLWKILDNSGNCTWIDYENDDFINGKIIRYNDITGRTVKFTYTGNDMTKMTLPDNREITYTYVNGFLCDVTYPGGRVATFTQDGTTGNLLLALDRTKNLAVRYDYTTANNITRVTSYKIGPYDAGILSVSAPDTHITMAYQPYSTRYQELTPNLGRTEQYVFNNMGQTTFAQDQDGYASYTAQGKAGGAKNKVTFDSDVQKTTVNLLKNHNFEQAASGSSIPHFTIDCAPIEYISDGYIGNKAVRINGGTNTGNRRIYQDIAVKPGKTYTLSAYYRTNSSSFESKDYGAHLQLELLGTSQVVRKDNIRSLNGYTRHQVTIEVPANASNPQLRASFGVSFDPFTLDVDCVQLEEGACANRYNILENAGWEDGWWTGYGTVNGVDERVTDAGLAHSGAYCYKIVGDPKAAKRVYQSVPVKGKKGEGLVCGAWIKTNGAPTKDTGAGTKQLVGITLEIKKTSGGSQYVNQLFTPTSYDWQYITLNAIADADFTDVLVHLKYSYNVNTVYFDDAQLYKDSYGESFVYDAKGNVISVVDMANNTSNIVNNSTTNDMTSYKDGMGYQYSFQYNNGDTAKNKEHKLTKATMPDGTESRFTYQANGGQTLSTTLYPKSFVTGKALLGTRKDYDNLNGGQGNYVWKDYDERDLATEFSYLNSSGLLSWKKEPYGPLSSTAVAQTSYVYSPNNTQDLISVTQSNVSNRVDYSYATAGNLTNVKVGPTTKYQNYGFTYDLYDNITEASMMYNATASTKTVLETNLYNTRNQLTQKTYGNGQVEKLAYDGQDHLTSVSLGSQVVNKFSYNHNGDLGKSAYYDDVKQKWVETYYEYDFAKRLVASSSTNGFDIKDVAYDKNNMDKAYTSALRNSSGVDIGYKNEFTFNNVNAVTKSVIAGQFSATPLATLEYRYDDWGRMDLEAIKTSDASNVIYVAKDKYDNYTNSAGVARTTNLLSEYRLRYTGVDGNPDYTYNFTYDRAGHIAQIKTTRKDGTAKTSNYTYDQLGQLTKATLGDGAYDYTYTYDQRYNITGWQKRTAGATTKRAESTYAYDANKLEQLTNFTKKDYAANGTTQTGQLSRDYTYDAIGNPTKIVQADGLSGSQTTSQYTLEWQRGKQLKRLQIGTTVDNKLYYDENDLLAKKVKKDGSSVNYYYSDGLLEYEEHLNASGTLTRVLKYFYDGDGRPQYLLSKTDHFDNDQAYNLYAYIYNGTGDVITLVRIRTQSGASTTETNVVAAEYAYSPYGEVVSVTGSDAIKDINPIRFKGYYYDTDSSWYRLTTRYYDPLVGRFINADDVSLLTESLEDLTDKNLYAYCDNNPLNRKDEDGELWNFVIFGAISAAIEVGSQIASGKKLNQISWGKVAFEGVTGSVGGPGGKIAKLAVKGAATLAAATAKKVGAKVATTARKVKSVKIEKIGMIKKADGSGKGYPGVVYRQNGKKYATSLHFHKHYGYVKGTKKARNYYIHWQRDLIKGKKQYNRGRWTLFGRGIYPVKKR